MLSDKFFQRLKSHGKPLHYIAWASGLTPNQLYKITSGIDRPKHDDPRIKALCTYLNLDLDDAFDTDIQE